MLVFSIPLLDRKRLGDNFNNTNSLQFKCKISGIKARRLLCRAREWGHKQPRVRGKSFSKRSIGVCLFARGSFVLYLLQIKLFS